MKKWFIGGATGTRKPHHIGPGKFRLFRPSGPLPPPKPVEFLAAPAVRKGAVLMLVALGASLKSWAALQLAFAVATGDEWLGLFPCRKGRATYMDFETSEESLSARVQRLCRGARRHKWPSNLDLCSRPDAFLNSKGFEERLLALARERDLIVIDSFRASNPTVDENDSRASAPLDMLGRIAQQTRCTFMVIHHPKKGGNKKIDPRERLRGSTAIFAALDAVFQISKRGGGFVADQTKAREDAPVSSFGLRLDDANGGVVLVGTDLGNASQSDDVSEEMLVKIRQTLATHPGLSGNALKRHVGGNDAKRHLALQQLAANEEIVNKGSERRASWRLASGASKPMRRAEREKTGTHRKPCVRAAFSKGDSNEHG
jgi:hypothetical protein